MKAASVRNSKILILGLGRATLPAARYLVERGADLYLYEERIDQLGTAAVQFLKSADIKTYAARKYDLVITSPGFQVDKPILNEILALGNAIVDEIEFTFEQLGRPPVIAVTGTNGKSTTVALISRILTEDNISHFMGGNIAPGKSFSEALFLPPYNYYVLEVSSFQLMRIINFKPHVALITNITRDHLNWHRDFDEYRRAKLRIFSNQNSDDYAVLNAADPELKKLSADLPARTILFGHDAHDGSWLNDDFHYRDQRLFCKDMLTLPGRHNEMNAMAAIAVAKILKIDNLKIEKAIVGFTALPHRLEDVVTKDGVRFVNNSMCTNESAAIESFKSFVDPKIVIVGGKEKGSANHRYLELLVREAKYCVVLGENATAIEAIFRRHAYTKYRIAGDMSEAVLFARQAAQPGDIVILNPGYASFDYYASFEARGEAFRKAVYED